MTADAITRCEAAALVPPQLSAEADKAIRVMPFAMALGWLDRLDEEIHVMAAPKVLLSKITHLAERLRVRIEEGRDLQ